MEYKWKPGWYADRLHAEKKGCYKHYALCGFIFPRSYPENKDWFNNKMKRGVPHCKKCERIIERLGG
jgi:hypothetical protein